MFQERARSERKRPPGLRDHGQRALDPQAGDRDAFGALSQRFERAVYSIALRRLGNHAEAQELNGQVYQLWRRGRSQEALPLARRALQIFEKTLGTEHPDTALAFLNLGAQYVALSRFREAETAYKQATALWEKVLGIKRIGVRDSF